jgi:hypothetical protein
LAACGGSGEQPISGSGAVEAVLPVLESVGWATDLSGVDSLSAQAGRPSAMMGAFAADYLQGKAVSLIESALTGIKAQQRLDELNDPRSGSAVTIFDLLSQLQRAENVDVADLLNRSNDRAVALDEYLNELSAMLQKGNAANDGLNAEMADLTQKHKDLQSQVSALTKNQQAAVKATDFQTAGAIQKDLDVAQLSLSTTDSQLKADKDAQKNLVTLLTIGKARKEAIDANREVLIAGLKVVDLPQTSSLGVLKGSSSKGGGLGSPFGSF